VGICNRIPSFYIYPSFQTSILAEISEENKSHENLKVYGEVSRADLKETILECVKWKHLAREMDQRIECYNEKFGFTQHGEKLDSNS
jgi:hypothetical protein